MKVGIITFNRAINYGAVLQSFALKNKIISLGHECTVINYYSEMVEKGASPFYLKNFSIKEILITILQIKMRLIKNKKFKNFSEKYLDCSSELFDKETIQSQKNAYDAIITGSDQVWNYEITGLDENYFLSFVSKETRKISYGASFGVSSIPKEYKQKYRKLLSHLDDISVRESSGADIVQELLGFHPEIVIDPVFLIKTDEWLKIAKDPCISEEYILVYSINKSKCYQIAEKIQKKTGEMIVGLQTPMSNRVKCKAIRDESPEEFLGWIKNAKYIITDSFHGTAFSIIFEKQFIFCNGGTGSNRLSRQRTLLEIAHLTDRASYPDEYEKIYEEIDYKVVKKCINIAVAVSENFLMEKLR